MPGINIWTVVRLTTMLVAGMVFVKIYILNDINLNIFRSSNALSIGNIDQQRTTSEEGAELRLIGVMTGGGGDRALIQAGSSDQRKWVFVGDTIEGWQLQKVSRERAFLEKEGLVTELQLLERSND